MIFRHELKHRISEADCYTLRNRLKYLMQPDPHGDAEGYYMVRSLYFDTPQDRALREKINGVDIREKFRIRYYNYDTNHIRLEKKSKRKGLNNKQHANLSREEAEAIMRGDWRRIHRPAEPLLQELHRKMQSEGLRPRTIVQYRRLAYRYPAGNVRVTFDSELKTGLYATSLFEPATPLITPRESVVLLEVKYDNFIPDHLVKLLQLGEHPAAAFSKYAACRVYG